MNLKTKINFAGVGTLIFLAGLGVPLGIMFSGMPSTLPAFRPPSSGEYLFEIDYVNDTLLEEYTQGDYKIPYWFDNCSLNDQMLLNISNIRADFDLPSSFDHYPDPSIDWVGNFSMTLFTENLSLSDPEWNITSNVFYSKEAVLWVEMGLIRPISQYLDYINLNETYADDPLYNISYWEESNSDVSIRKSVSDRYIVDYLIKSTDGFPSSVSYSTVGGERIVSYTRISTAQTTTKL